MTETRLAIFQRLELAAIYQLSSVPELHVRFRMKNMYKFYAEIGRSQLELRIYQPATNIDLT